MHVTRKRKLEHIIYISIFLLIFIAFLLDVVRARNTDGLAPLTGSVFVHISLTMLPFVALFVIHNSLVIPRLLLRNRYLPYLLATSGLIALVWGCQAWAFMTRLESMPPHGGPMRGPSHIVPLPMFLDLVYDILIVGVNLAAALIFQRLDDKLERERMQKREAQNQLAYLKAQINPHFYMNMLNNIHAMIDIDAERAQDMLINMSKLMRYTLYDSSCERIALSSEIAFLNNYLSLMKQRYPDNRVSITSRFPDPATAAGVMVPPLLFLVFIENSFKHGISYHDRSFVDISITIEGRTLTFRCVNSRHPSAADRPSGIGLKNISERLRLIYGNRFSYDVDTDSDQGSYSVTLSIPLHDESDDSSADSHH